MESASEPVTFTVPAAIVVVPLEVLLPARVSVPPPALSVRVPEPATLPVIAADRLLTLKVALLANV